MTITGFIHNVKGRLWYLTIHKTRKWKIYPFLYCSYWHSILNIKKKSDLESNNYFTAVPNPKAGIGHQLANWIAGFWFARQFNLSFAHTPFSSPSWDFILGLGEDEVLVNDLINRQNYKKVRLPLFNENKNQEIELIKGIIQSYTRSRIVFVCEQDQFYKNQFGVMDDLRRKFRNSRARKENSLIFSNDNYNVAIHVRRGDIVVDENNTNENLLMRWQNNEYFKNVLNNVIKTLKIDKQIDIYLFSQGRETDFEEFNTFQNLRYCLGMSAQDSFLHMIAADLLITSKSSFSYKPALMSEGIKICPNNFWHGYPNDCKWILVDEAGNFDFEKLLHATSAI